MSVDGCEHCADCGSALAAGQRYCLDCGARIGPPSPQLSALLGRVREAGGAADPAGEASEPAVAPQGAESGRRAQLTLPTPRVSAFLVLVFLGFGVLLGGAARGPVNDTLASSSGPLKVVLPQSTPSAPQASAAGSSSAASSPESAGEPPETKPESTPAPAPAAGAASSSAASTSPAAHSPASSTPTPAPSSAEKEGGSSGSPSSGGSTSKLPPVKHVFVIMLSDQPYAAIFGPSSSAHYLSQTLEQRGALLTHYDAVAHEELADGVALLSGQGPTAETAANCLTYTDVAPATVAADEQLLGNGCVYPSATQTLAGQLTAKHLTWRSYVEGIDEAGAQEPACAHPVLGQADPTTAQAASGERYATFRDPFVYFHSVIDSPACSKDVVGLASLKGDLAQATRTPSFSYIVPDRCHDANPTPCSAGAPAGPAAADGFLSQVVPEITGSKAYKQNGLLVITVDEAPSSGEFADSSSCCGQPQFPNLAPPPGGLSPRGGGAVGALLLSPFIKGASTSQEPYNHFSLLRTIEDLFGLKHLGYAGLSKVSSFEPAIFSAATG